MYSILLNLNTVVGLLPKVCKFRQISVELELARGGKFSIPPGK